MPDERRERCGDCRFWFEIEQKGTETPREPDGICKRFPPSLFSSSSYVLETDWCGEFQPKGDRLARLIPVPMATLRQDDIGAVDESRWREFESGLSIHIRKRLRFPFGNDGIHPVLQPIKSFSDLLACKEAHLRLIRGIGDLAVEQIRKRLAEFGLKLRGD